jgi:hypothetical protein
MNTNRLAKHYGTLSPTERLALIVNAAARGDEQEIGRLRSSAPREDWRMSHHSQMADRLKLMLSTCLLELLNDASHGLRAIMFARSPDISGPVEKGMYSSILCAERWMDEYRLCAYCLVTRLRGWRLFAERNGLDPDFLFEGMPGWEMIGQCAEVAESVLADSVITKTEIEAMMSKRLGVEFRTFTAEKVAVALERYYRDGGVSAADPIDA